MFQSYKLKNNANVILVPQNDTKSVTVLIMYPVGSRYEPEKLSGVSHYVEHLMFKGTKKRKNTLALTREIDRLGAQYNAFTGKEYTGYYIKTDAEYTEKAVDILSDMLFNSTFDPKEMEREKTVIVEEIKMYNDNPMMNMGNVFEQTMYAGALGRDIAGTAKHVLGYKRKDVLAYRDKYYQPENMYIAIAGAVPENIHDLLDEYVGSQKNNKAVSNSFQKGEFGSSKKADRLTVEHKQTDQMQMMLGFPGLAYGHKDSYALNVLNTILGGSMSSRLFIRIRERLGLAYMVRSRAEYYRDTGYSYIRVGLDKSNVNKAIAAIQKELEKIKDKPVTKSELKDAKTHIRGAMTLKLEDSSDVAAWFVEEAVFSKKIETPEDYLEKIDRVTAADIQRVAKKVFKPSQMRVGMIGDIEKNAIRF